MVVAIKRCILDILDKQAWKVEEFNYLLYKENVSNVQWNLKQRNVMNK